MRRITEALHIRVWPTRRLYEYTYPNGIRVDVTNRGVTIWDDDAGPRWVIDASTLVDGDPAYIANVATNAPPNWTEFNLKYPKRRDARTRRAGG